MRARRSTPELRNKVKSLIDSGVPNKEIAVIVEIPYTQVMSIKRRLAAYQKPSAILRSKDEFSKIDAYLRSICTKRLMDRIEAARSNRGDNTKGKITPVIVALVADLDKQGYTGLGIARALGIDQATVSRIVNRKYVYKPKRVATKPIPVLVPSPPAQPQPIPVKPGLLTRLWHWLF